MRLVRRPRPGEPPPEPAVTPVYQVLPTFRGGEELWEVRDGLEVVPVCKDVPTRLLGACLAGLAASQGRSVDVGVGEDLWVRVHPDGSTVPAARPWSVRRYEEMRERDRRDRELLGALAAARDQVAGALRRVARAQRQAGGAAVRAASHARGLARTARVAAVRAGRGWRPGLPGARTGRTCTSSTSRRD